MTSKREQPLRPGDIVEVKSAAEILATLDEDGSLDKMPFMPEMIRHAGRRYTVSRRVDKICDTIAASGSRRMHDTVYLDDLRCDGSGHGGCQAGCKIYWKESWLRRVEDAPPRPIPAMRAWPSWSVLRMPGHEPCASWKVRRPRSGAVRRPMPSRPPSRSRRRISRSTGASSGTATSGRSASFAFSLVASSWRSQVASGG